MCNRWALFCAVAFAVSGCSSGLSALTQSVQQLRQRPPSVDNVELAGPYSYLRVTSKNSTAIFALVQFDPHPEGGVLVWQSALGEVLRIQDGRLIGAVGLRTEWRSVAMPKLLTWPELAASPDPFHWVRTRDVMPGYKFGIREDVAVRKIPSPEKTALKGVDPKALTWFEERSVRSDAVYGTSVGRSSGDFLPPTRYAVLMDPVTVLYAEQCVAADLCFTWQRWSAEMQKANMPNAVQPKQ